MKPSPGGATSGAGTAPCGSRPPVSPRSPGRRRTRTAEPANAGRAVAPRRAPCQRPRGLPHPDTERDRGRTARPLRRPGPRPGGKLGRVLEEVAAAGGATLAELAGLTGWRPHTTRAALTRLRQRGYAFERLDLNGRKAYRLGAAR